jgi:hypothetical protein
LIKILPAMALPSLPERPKILPQDPSDHYDLVHIGQFEALARGGHR